MTTKIEWCARPGTLPEVWNTVGGCHPKSDGCQNCWAARMAATRLKHHPLYEGLTKWVDGKPRWTGEIRLDWSKLEQPLHWKKPRTVFVSSTSDLFHPQVSRDFRYNIFSVMACCPQHRFLILTKRPREMFEWFIHPIIRRGTFPPEGSIRAEQYGAHRWPLSNVWLGISAENQQYADERFPLLLGTPAAVRFASLEPLLGKVNIEPYLFSCPECGGSGYVSDGRGSGEFCGCNAQRGLDHVIIGAESGSDACYCDLDWIRDIVKQCKAAGVPVFVKQLGTHWAKRFNDAAVFSKRHSMDWPWPKRADYKGADMNCWLEDLRVREFPQ